MLRIRIVFEAKANNTGDGTITRQANPVIDGHFWGTFSFQDNFDAVRITNESALDLIINNIDLIQHVSSQPKVVLDTSPPIGSENGGPNASAGDSVSMQFDIVQSRVPAIIDIRDANLQPNAAADPSNIILAGGGLPGTNDAAIENPAGDTRILNTLGDILSQPPAGSRIDHPHSDHRDPLSRFNLMTSRAHGRPVQRRPPVCDEWP